MNPVLIVILIVIFVVISIILISGIRVVNQTEKYIIERMGAFYKTWGVGVHWLIQKITLRCKLIQSYFIK